MIDIALLEITGAVFHQVPTKATSEGKASRPMLSTAESTLESRLELFLRDRLTRTFSRAAQPVVRDEAVASPTPDIVTSALQAGVANIVEPFHPLPALLLDVQAHNSPEGLLAVIRGACGPTPVVVLVKVEQERGMSFETVGSGDDVRVEVVIEEGLVFTDKTDVFKAAIFYLDDGELAGYLTDDQTGSIYHGPASLYWLGGFLGCKYQVGPDVQTRAWIKGIERLVRSDLGDPVDQDRVFSAMLVELQSNERQIDPERFIERYVPEDAHDRALERLRDAGAPTRRFVKSQDVGTQAPKKKRFVFDGGFQVTMPADAVPDLSKDEVDGVEVDVLTIRGHIQSVH
jgi:hypothetical protein